MNRPFICMPLHCFRTGPILTGQRVNPPCFLALALLVLVPMAGCAPSIASYSARAYEQAVDLKVDTLRLIERAEQPYETHRSRVESLQVRLLKAREFARGRAHNEMATSQWDIMVDPDGHMAGGFLSRWAAEDSLSWAFIREVSIQIESGFDTIIRLESGKKQR